MSHPRELWADRAYTSDNSVLRVPYPTALATFGQSLFRGAALRALRRALPGISELTVDLGCGVGDWALGYRRFSRRVLAVDVNPAFLAEGRRRASRRAVTGVDFVRADVATAEIPDGAGLVAVGSVFQYLRDDEIRAVLSRAARAQRRAGVLYVRASVARDAESPWDAADATYRAVTFYEREFSRHGYSVRFRGTSAALLLHGLGGILLPGRPRRRGPPGRATAYANWILEKA